MTGCIQIADNSIVSESFFMSDKNMWGGMFSNVLSFSVRKITKVFNFYILFCYFLREKTEIVWNSENCESH